MSSEYRLDSCPDDPHGLQVIFTWQGDRYTHRIVRRKATDEEGPLLDAVQEHVSPTWPASPPLQQISIETRADLVVALLVGMAGRSHWSASVEVFQAANRIRFDIACLARAPVDYLGSRYLLPAVRPRGNPFAVDAETSLTLSPQVPTRLNQEADVLEIRPEIGEAAAESQTVRWQYTIERRRKCD